MMYTLTEQVTFIAHFIILGMFLGATYTILNSFLCNTKMKIWLKYIIEIIYWVILTLVFVNYMLKISDGYLPVCTFLFYIVGIVIHFIFFQKQLTKDVDYIYTILAKVFTYLKKFFQKLKKIVIIFMLPTEVVIFLKENIKKIIKKVFKGKKNENEENIDNDIITSGNDT